VGAAGTADPDAFDLDAWDLDDDDRDDVADGAGATDRPAPRGRWGGGRVRVAVVGGAAVAVVVLVTASHALRSPQERLEDRLTEALGDAGVQLAEPVSLEDDGDGGVWTGRLRVEGPDGRVSGVRVALRPEAGESSAPTATAGLFPLVDCTTRYPLSWAGDSDTSFRTTRSDLAECVTGSPGGGTLVTIAWVADDSGGAGGGAVAEGRQTWRTDPRGGVVWLHNGSGGGRGSSDGSDGMTGEQQRAVATAEGLLAPL
jgi:hypothetical protein